MFVDFQWKWSEKRLQKHLSIDCNGNQETSNVIKFLPSLRSSVGKASVLSHVVRQWQYTSMWIKWFSFHTGHQEVSRCCTRGESEESLAHR